MHIVVIGGASTYTPELIDGLIQRAHDLGLTKITLCDPNHERLAIVGAFAQRMAAHYQAPFTVELSHDRRAAILRWGYSECWLKNKPTPPKGQEH
jgi:6-phospho-beta-glucosidase